jgi:hypothetical protein
VARIRTIKPEFASDRKLSGLSRGARLTFVLLITQADDDGLVLGSPRQLLGQLYPHDESVDLATLSRELRELADLGLVRARETVDDAPVVELTNWSKHQKIDHKGKSLIANQLRPFSDEPRDILASVSRESRAPTLDLGPRTVDLGPTTTDLSRSAEKTPNGQGGGWPAAIADAWTRTVGVISPGRVGKDLLPFVKLYPSPAAAESALVAAVRIYDDTCTRRSQSPKWVQFVAGVQGYVPQNQLPPTRVEVA